MGVGSPLQVKWYHGRALGSWALVGLGVAVMAAAGGALYAVVTTW